MTHAYSLIAIFSATHAKSADAIVIFGDSSQDYMHIWCAEEIKIKQW